MKFPIKKADIIISAVQEEQYPKLNLPEIAIAGRSNVGKSSLINSLLNRKSLARTSRKPGRTVTINFYNIDDQLIFVDVPGYGYAKVSKLELEKWSEMMEHYFSTREILKKVVLIVDLRHPPTKQDIQMYDYLKFLNLPVVVVATKADKVKPGVRNRHMNHVNNTLNIVEGDQVIPFSAVTGEGKKEVWRAILNNIGIDGK
ncbi:MAG: ribosome biogenesis GTP-binding protein YihA/YsxC [Staphylococcus equorum]|nr:ribosome biogenesis GTP-binding protein YihA/YsxC [Staphylococcus equorum]